MQALPKKECCGHAQLETNVVIGSTALNSLVEKWVEARFRVGSGQSEELLVLGFIFIF